MLDLLSIFLKNLNLNEDFMLITLISITIDYELSTSWQILFNPNRHLPPESVSGCSLELAAAFVRIFDTEIPRNLLKHDYTKRVW